jgi:hypothetical protein
MMSILSVLQSWPPVCSLPAHPSLEDAVAQPLHTSPQ